MAGGAGSKRFDGGSFGFRSSCRSGAVTSVGDDVWRRIFDRLWLAGQACDESSDRTTAAPMPKTSQQSKYVQTLSNANAWSTSDRARRHPAPSKAATGDNGTRPDPSAWPEAVLAGQHRSGDGSRRGFKMVRGWSSANIGQKARAAKRARQGPLLAAQHAGSCRSHRWIGTHKLLLPERRYI